VLPALRPLPSNKNYSSDHHNSYNKNPNLAFFSFTESPFNSLLTKNFQKIISHLLITTTCPKQQWPKFGYSRDLGVKAYYKSFLNDAQWIIKFFGTTRMTFGVISCESFCRPFSNSVDVVDNLKYNYNSQIQCHIMRMSAAYF
jgi:hypothetical protein